MSRQDNAAHFQATVREHAEQLPSQGCLQGGLSSFQNDPFPVSVDSDSCS